MDLEDTEASPAALNKDPDFEGNPSFVVVDHELATPDGVEGPSPIYVKPPVNFDGNGEPLPDATNRTIQTIEADSNNAQTSRKSEKLQKRECYYIDRSKKSSSFLHLYHSFIYIIYP